MDPDRRIYGSLGRQRTIDEFRGGGGVFGGAYFRSSKMSGGNGNCVAYEFGTDGEQEVLGSLQLAYARRKGYKNQRTSASPPLTEDSGQWSSSFPSSPVKEQSPHSSSSRSTANKHLKSSSGSTSSCEYSGGGVKKSQLYGTPHWWPLDQEEGADSVPRKRESYLTTERLNGGAGNCGDSSSARSSSEMTSENITQKPSRALAFTINFDENENNGGAASLPLPLERKKMTTSLPRPKMSSLLLQSTSAAPPTPIVSEAVDLVAAATEGLTLEVTETPEAATGACDVKSDNGTYTLDDDDSSHVERRSTDIPVTEIDSNEWIQKWATEASAHVPDMNSIPPYDDTFKILDETRNIVNAIQNRVSSEVPRKASTTFGPKHGETTTSIKLNRAFSIRRNLNTNQGANAQKVMSQSHTYDSDTPMSTTSLMSDRYSGNSNFQRSDGGRFSLRAKKGTGSLSDTEVRDYSYVGSKKREAVQPSKPLHNTPVRSKSILSSASVSRNSNSQFHTGNSNNNNNISGPSQKLQTRSNSTVTSRDIEMENWKRRKSYDPLKSAGMGVTNKSLSRVEDIKKQAAVTTGPSSRAQSTTSSTMSNMRSTANSLQMPNTASSSGTSRIHHKRIPSGPVVPVGLENRRSQLAREGSATEYEVTPSTSESSVQSFSPIPPVFDHNCCGDFTRMQDWMMIQQQLNRSSCDSSPRKFEALDTLVISTIFSLTSKVRNLSLGLLKKIQPNHVDDENSALLEEMITQLNELATSQAAEKQGQKSSSRELSGILKNVKKMEQVVLVLDRILCEGDEEDN